MQAFESLLQVLSKPKADFLDVMKDDLYHLMKHQGSVKSKTLQDRRKKLLKKKSSIFVEPQENLDIDKVQVIMHSLDAINIGMAILTEPQEEELHLIWTNQKFQNTFGIDSETIQNLRFNNEENEEFSILDLIF